MLSRAIARYIRMSPRKARYVMEPLRQRTVAQALNWLASTNRRAAKPVAKAIASAFANAKQKDPALGEEQLIISRLTADGGPMWKRFRPAAFGRAVRIRKRTCHIIVELDRAAVLRPPLAAAPQAPRAKRQTKPPTPGTQPPARAAQKKRARQVAAKV